MNASDRITSLNFGAKHIKSTKIKKFSQEKLCYIPSSVNIIEIERKKSDIRSLFSAAKDWGNDSYVKDITSAMSCGALNEEDVFKVYAITTQKGNFENLDSSKLLGVADVYYNPNSGVHLDMIQVKPDDKYGAVGRKFKKVGSSILDFLKSEYNTRIYLYADKDAIPFYKSNGFKKSQGILYEWYPKM